MIFPVSHKRLTVLLLTSCVPNPIVQVPESQCRFTKALIKNFGSYRR